MIIRQSVLSFAVMVGMLSPAVKTFPQTGDLCSSVELETNLGVDREVYEEIFEDDKVSDAERKYLYDSYYPESPGAFISHATYYGADENSWGELLQYGLWIRQQMWRGWVLIGSGEYGYHPEIAEELNLFIRKYYSYKNPFDFLLAEQKSPVYFFFADGGLNRSHVDEHGQFIPVEYDDLNPRQQRVYDLTSMQAYKAIKRFKVDPSVQMQMTPEEALASGKYVSIVSAKSINDFGRRFLFYKCNGLRLQFIGVVLVGGEAKRTDWTGLGETTNINFKFDHFPLCIREDGGQDWGFDLPRDLYEVYGGTVLENGKPAGGNVFGIIAVDPDLPLVK